MCSAFTHYHFELAQVITLLGRRLHIVNLKIFDKQTHLTVILSAGSCLRKIKDSIAYGSNRLRGLCCTNVIRVLPQ